MEKFLDANENAHTSTSPGSARDVAISDHGQVHKVSVRIPPFWPEEPEIWFAQLEGQFVISGITSDSTKFNYVIGQLDNKYAREVKDLILNPPATEKYATLKNELIKRLTTSNDKKILQMLRHEELGDRKPSQFLRHLKGLYTGEFPKDLLKTMWVSRLPVGIQTVLAGQPASATLDHLATLADQIHDLSHAPMNVATTSSTFLPGSILSELMREVSELRREFRQMSTQRSSRERTPSRDSNRSRHRSSSRSQSRYRNNPICWYHIKFGEKAQRCNKPCDYKTSENFPGSR